MPVTPDGPVAGPLALLRAMLAACPTWIDWASDADGHIYYMAVDRPDEGWTAESNAALRPLAMIDLDPRESCYSTKRVSGGSAFYFGEDAGKLMLYIEATPLEDATAGEAKMDFANKIGAIIRELAEQAGQEGTLMIDELTLQDGPHFCAEEQVEGEGDHLFAFISVAWGL